jgi:hypothetical protein
MSAMHFVAECGYITSGNSKSRGFVNMVLQKYCLQQKNFFFLVDFCDFWQYLPISLTDWLVSPNQFGVFID